MEFWHDDPLLELSDEFQVCPDPADAETVTRVYEPPGGRFEPLPIVDGDAQIPSDLAPRLQAAMDELADKDGVRLRFVGFTRNERLSRRTAEIYGDDIERTVTWQGDWGSFPMFPRRRCTRWRNIETT